MKEKNLPQLEVKRKSGSENFHANGSELEINMLSFWQWSSSDLVGNTMRGILAEYLVACDLGIADRTRVEWNAYDLLTREGIKVEVKSAAYIQSWKQTALSNINFGIQQTVGWNASTNEYSKERKRQADVYVFALLKHKDKTTIDPLNVEQWEFYILPSKALDEELQNQKNIGLNTLLKHNPVKATYGEISTVIKGLFPGCYEKHA